MPVVLYGCETLSLTWRVEHGLRVLRIFGSKREEVTGEWRKLYNEELNVLHSLPSIAQVIKLRRMRCTVHVAHVRRGEVLLAFGRERNHLEDPGIDERIILRWIFRKWDVGAWTGPICLKIGVDGGHL